jgi:hypothetical protein
MGHWFTARKKEEVVGIGIHSNDAARAGVVESIASGGCYDVEELVLVGGGMWGWWGYIHWQLLLVARSKGEKNR